MIAVALAASQATRASTTSPTQARARRVSVGGHTFTYLGTTHVDGRARRSIVKADVQHRRRRRLRAGAAAATGPRARRSARRRCAPGSREDVYLTARASARRRRHHHADGACSCRSSLWLWIGGRARWPSARVLAAFPGRRRRRPTDPVSAPIGPSDAGATAAARAGRRAARWLTSIEPRRPSRARPASRRRAAAAPSLFIAARPSRSCWPCSSWCSPVAKSGAHGHGQDAAARPARARRAAPPPSTASPSTCRSARAAGWC